MDIQGIDARIPVVLLGESCGRRAARLYAGFDVQSSCGLEILFATLAGLLESND
jgi:hypothetical protein